MFRTKLSYLLIFASDRNTKAELLFSFTKFKPVGRLRGKLM